MNNRVFTAAACLTVEILQYEVGVRVSEYLHNIRNFQFVKGQVTLTAFAQTFFHEPFQERVGIRNAGDRFFHIEAILRLIHASCRE